MNIKSLVKFFKENGKMNIKSLIEFFKEYGPTLPIITIIIVSFISLSILIYYSDPAPRCKTNSNNSNITIHTVDNHEYLVYRYDRAGGICHKVDCKFCITKNGKD